MASKLGNLLPWSQPINTNNATSAGTSREKHKIGGAAPTTKAGKRMQLLRIVGITMVPISILLALIGNIFIVRLNEFLQAQEVRRTIRFSVEVSKLVDQLQKERDFSVIYSSSIGIDTKNYLLEHYAITDAAIQNLTDWASSDDHQLDFFQSKEKFQNYLNRHRYELDTYHPSEKEELKFYSDMIEIFIQWFYDAITETGSGTVWKLLVALQETMGARLEFGIERAYGSIYYIQGGFQSRQEYLIFAKAQDVANITLNSARLFSADVEGAYQESVTDEQQQLFETVVRKLQKEIRFNPFPEGLKGSVQKAKYWSDNMTLFVDSTLAFQNTLTLRIYDQLLGSEKTEQRILTILGVIVLVVIVMCQRILKAVYALTCQIQSYSLKQLKRTTELKEENQRTDTLLCQLLPKSVAEKLKLNQNVSAEHYKDVTIFFSDIEDFTRISARSTPAEVVTMLDSIYTSLDECLDLYDVYKVETIGDAYMVASGLAELEGKHHSSEIAAMSLDILDRIKAYEIPHLPGTTLRMRIGIHTGPVVAGIVGTKMPRYALFGETVIIASLMEDTGIAGRVQISEKTYKSLQGHPEFAVTPRGSEFRSEQLQGMQTYWLTRSSASAPCSAGDNVHDDAGQLEHVDRITSPRLIEVKEAARPMSMTCDNEMAEDK